MVLLLLSQQLVGWCVTLPDTSCPLSVGGPYHPHSMVLADVATVNGAEKAGTPSSAQQGASQRITPYMSRVAARSASASKAYVHTPTTGGKFAERQGAGSVVASLNSHLEVLAAAGSEAMDVDGGEGHAAAASLRCDFVVLGQPLPADCKYMVDRLEDKVRGAQGGGWVGRVLTCCGVAM
jgi:hypothetical protein